MTRLLPYRALDIQFPGYARGRFHAITKHTLTWAAWWLEQGGDMLVLHQPWGGEDIPLTRGYKGEFVNKGMPGYCRGLGVHPLAVDAAKMFRKAGGKVAVYGGACWGYPSGTPTQRDVRYVAQDDLDNIEADMKELATLLPFDYYWQDDKGMELALVGMAKGQQWANPMEDEARKPNGDPSKFVIREGHPGPIRWPTATLDTFTATQTGLGKNIIVGVEPDPRAQGALVDKMLPPATPFMQIVDPHSIAAYPVNDSNRLGILIWNSNDPSFTLADYHNFRSVAEAKGYSTNITAFAMGVLLRNDGRTVPGGG